MDAHKLRLPEQDQEEWLAMKDHTPTYEALRLAAIAIICGGALAVLVGFVMMTQAIRDLAGIMAMVPLAAGAIIAVFCCAIGLAHARAAAANCQTDGDCL
jgi:hypothetical protein